MDNLELLIENAIDNKPKAIRELISFGNLCFDDIISTIRSREDVGSRGLLYVIEHLKDSESIQEVKKIIISYTVHSNDSGIVISGVKMLLSRLDYDNEVKQIFRNILVDHNYPLFIKEKLLESLGNYKSSNAPALLHLYIESEISREDELLIIVEDEKKHGDFERTRCILHASISLIKHDDFTYSWIPRMLYTLNAEQEILDKSLLIRELCFDVFAHFKINELELELLSGLNDWYYEVRRSVLFSLYVAGNKEVIPLMIHSLLDEDHINSANAGLYLTNIVGDVPFDLEFIEDINNIFKWWSSVEPEFQNGICYRGAEPISLDYFEGKIRDKNTRALAFRELQLYTGENFNYENFSPIENQWELPKLVKVWVENNLSKFEKGHRYVLGKKLM